MNPLHDDQAPRDTAGWRERRAARRQGQERQEELNMVSMIDVFAVLVFFLLVSGSITATQLKALQLSLPTAAVTSAAPPQPLLLTLRHDRLQLSGPQGRAQLKRSAQGPDLAALARWLEVARRTAPAQTQAILRVEADIEYDEVVQVMSTLREQRYAQISLGDAEDAT